MKCILLGTSLLLLAGLCGQPVHADGTYTPSVTLVSPKTNDVYPFNQGSNASIPVSVTNQFVQITGATPSRTSYVGWSMFVKVTVYNSDGTPRAGQYLVQDSSAGVIAVPIKPDGSWQWKANGSGTYTQTYQTNIAASWTIDAGSSIQDAGGNNKVLLYENPFTTIMLYYS